MIYRVKGNTIEVKDSKTGKHMLTIKKGLNGTI